IRSVVVDVYRYGGLFKNGLPGAEPFDVAAIQRDGNIVFASIAAIYPCHLKPGKETVYLRHLLFEKHRNFLSRSGQSERKGEGRSYGIPVRRYMRQYRYIAGISQRFSYLFKHLSLSCCPGSYHL